MPINLILKHRSGTPRTNLVLAREPPSLTLAQTSARGRAHTHQRATARRNVFSGRSFAHNAPALRRRATHKEKRGTNPIPRRPIAPPLPPLRLAHALIRGTGFAPPPLRLARESAPAPGCHPPNSCIIHSGADARATRVRGNVPDARSDPPASSHAAAPPPAVFIRKCHQQFFPRGQLAVAQ